MLVTDELEVDESEGERVDETEKVEHPEAEFDALLEPLGESVLVPQVEGDSDWVGLVLTVTVLLKVPETVLQPEPEALPDSLTLNVGLMVPEGQLEEDTLGELEVVEVRVTRDVGLTLVVVDKDTLSVPVLQ